MNVEIKRDGLKLQGRILRTKKRVQHLLFFMVLGEIPVMRKTIYIHCLRIMQWTVV